MTTNSPEQTQQLVDTILTKLDSRYNDFIVSVRTNRPQTDMRALDLIHKTHVLVCDYIRSMLLEETADDLILKLSDAAYAVAPNKLDS